MDLFAYCRLVLFYCSTVINFALLGHPLSSMMKTDGLAVWMDRPRLPDWWLVSKGEI